MPTQSGWGDPANPTPDNGQDINWRNLYSVDKWGGAIARDWNWLGGNQGTQNLQKNRGALAPYLNAGNPYINPQDPQAGNYKQLNQQGYSSLIQMLQARAAGQGPSVAGDAYNNASTNAMQNMMTMSNSGNESQARQAMQQMGNVNQGLAQGYASARNQEMQGATGQLGSVLGQYGTTLNQQDSSQLLRDKANQDAWLQMLKDQFGSDEAMANSSKNNGDMIGSIIKAVAAG